MKKTLIIGIVMVVLLSIPISVKNREVSEKERQYLKTDYEKVEYYINTYSTQYDIPMYVLEHLFKKETGWELRRKERYKASLVGDGGRSFGAGQIQLPTARAYRPGIKITPQMLKYDIKFNVETTCIILRADFDTLSKIKQVRPSDSTLWVWTLASYNMGIHGFMRSFRPNNYATSIH